MMRPATLQWVGAAMRLPLRVLRVVAVAPARLLYFCLVPRGFARRQDGKPRRLGALVTAVEDHVGYGCAQAWWASDAQARQLGSDDPVACVVLRGRPTRNGRR